MKRLTFLCALCVGNAALAGDATNAPIVSAVAEGPDWVRLEYRRDIVPGSALDFSAQGLHDAPAGKYGWLVSRNGHAEFENRPGVPARFYGVNLCETANYLTDDEIERVTDRLVRLGYNAVRLHHHDDAWAKDSSSSRARLDALVAACIRKGIYFTTDLFVSRKCAWRDLGVDQDGNADSQSAKLRMMTTEAGFTNWCAFARAFLTHVNPHTGRCLAEEPAMPMLVLINESSPHSDWDKAKAIPEFRALWPQWLAEARAQDSAAFPTASAGSFPDTGGWWDPSPENSAKAAFWAWVCARFANRATAFLRDELGVQALISTENHGPTLPSILQMRATAGGYVDSHFYTENTSSATQAMRDETGLPITYIFRNHNPLKSTKGMYPSAVFHRVWGRLFVVSESQMSGPNFNRAMAGLLTGTSAAVQDWTGVWTFALAHGREKLFDGVNAEPGRYDLSLDPLMQATDRLPALLFLRGDQATPSAAFANSFSATAMQSDARGQKSFSSSPSWAGNGLEWRARLGVAFEGVAAPSGVQGIAATASNASQPTAASSGVAVDADNGEIVVTQPRTSAAFVQAGSSFEAGALSASVRDHSALVAATALGGASLTNASRILVWHLTDLHGEGFSWGGQVTSQSHRHTGILDWGTSRLMLRDGEADIALRVNRHLHVYALDTAGNRRAEVPATYNAATGVLRFTASSRQAFGGCLYYEVAADLAVGQGDARTLSANTAYDAIVVNGSLTVAEGVAVTAASLVVATNIAGAASVTLAPGASLTLSGDVHLGYDGGQAHLNVLSGASLTVGGNLCMAYGHTAAPAANAEPTRAFLTVSNATVTVNGSDGLNFEQSTSWPSGTTQKSTSVDTVRLEAGAVIECQQIRKAAADGGRSSTIVFAGGRIEAGRWNYYVFHLNSKNATLYLESENGSPIHVKNSSKINRWFNFGTASAWIKVSGAGELVLENTTQYPDVNWKSGSWDEAKPNVTFLTGGRVRLVGGNLTSYPQNAFAAVTNANWTHLPRALVLESGATIDMKGVDAEFSSVDGAVSNSTGAACTLTLGGDGSNSAYSSPLPSGVALRKIGAGSLSLSAGTANDIFVEGGLLSLCTNATCGAIVANGDIAIAEGVAVTAASLVVVTNIAGAASVTLAPDSSLALSGDVHLGYDGGQAHLNVQSGAGLTVGGNLCMAYGHTAPPAANAEPTRAFLTITNATVKINGGDGLNFDQGTSWPSGTTQRSSSVDTVRLEAGAVIECQQIRKASADGGRSSAIVFVGGRIEAGRWNYYVFHLNSKNATLYLESENGNPIYIKDNSKINRWFNFGTASASIAVSGDGDFVLENTTQYRDVNWQAGSWDEDKPNVTFLTGGRIRLVGGNLVSYPRNAFSTVNGGCLRSLVLERGATIDMKGVDAAFTSFDDGGGAISNSTSAACALTIGGDNADAVHPYPLALPSGVTLWKAGTGTLSLLAADAADVSVQGGTLSFVGRAEVGYPFYKFNIRGTANTGTTNHRVQLSEFKFLDGENDVTQGFDAYHYENRDTGYYNQPTAMWDGDVNTDFYDQRDQSWSSISNCAPVLEYRPPRKVTGYTWFTANDWNRRRDNYPVSWAVFGSADNVNWEQLDAVDGFSLANPGLREWCGTNFVCAYAPTTATIASLAVASGATLAVDGADITVSSVTAADAVTVTLAHGATLALPAATEVASLSVDVDAVGGTLANFNPAADGALYLTGNVGRPSGCVVPVAVGTLEGGNVRSWRVYVDGQLQRDVGVFVNADGFLQTESRIPTTVMLQ